MKSKKNNINGLDIVKKTITVVSEKAKTISKQLITLTNLLK